MGEGRADRAGKLQRAIDHLVHVAMELREADKGEDTGKLLGELIADARAAWGLTQSDLASKLATTKGWVSQIENHRVLNPTAGTIAALADELRLPPVQVLNAALNSLRFFRPTPSKDKADG